MCLQFYVVFGPSAMSRLTTRVREFELDLEPSNTTLVFVNDHTLTLNTVNNAGDFLVSSANVVDDKKRAY